MLSIAVLDVTFQSTLHLNDRLTYNKCLLDQVISFFSERLEIPAPGVESRDIATSTTTWTWEAPPLKESYTPQSRAGTRLHAPLLTLRAIKHTQSDFDLVAP
jgi:hypothetical protein